MSNNKEVRIEAKTIEAAVVMACVKLGITQDNIEYEVVRQPKSGIMSLFGGKAEIKAWARNGGGRQGAHYNEKGHRNKNNNDRGPKKNHDSARNAKSNHQGNGNSSNFNKERHRDHDRKSNHRNSNHNGARQNHYANAEQHEREPAEPLTAEQINAIEVEIRNFCKELCEMLVGEKVAVSSSMSPDRLQIEVDSEEIAQMIKGQEKFVESLEHLLRKKPRHLKQDLPFRIFVDAHGSRKGRETDIAKVALEKADQVVATGQKAVLDLKSAADRKIVHMTLEQDERVYTKSIGNGPSRKLLILPSRGRKPSSEGSSFEQESESDS